MNQQDAIERYMQILKNTGVSDEMIAMYRQQMEQSMQASSQWASQLSQFGQNIQQFNAMFNGNSLYENKVPTGNTLMLNPDIVGNYFLNGGIPIARKKCLIIEIGCLAKGIELNMISSGKL